MIHETSFERARLLFDSGLVSRAFVTALKESDPFISCLVFSTPSSLLYLRGYYSEKTNLFYPVMSIIQWLFCRPDPITLYVNDRTDPETTIREPGWI